MVHFFRSDEILFLILAVSRLMRSSVEKSMVHNTIRNKKCKF